MKKPLQVLVVEDNASDALLLRQMFSKDGGSFQLTHMLRMSDAQAHLAKSGVDIILLDMDLPDGQGLDIVRRAQAVAPVYPSSC